MRDLRGREMPGIASLPNLRDVGGHETRDGGRVRAGLLLRSAALHRLRPEDAAAFAALGIRTVYDLRTRSERTTDPDPLSPETRYVALDLIGDEPRGGPDHLMEIFKSPVGARAELGDGRATALWVENYRRFVLRGSARAALGQLYTGLADARGLPALVHCTTGKDRTGWAAAALLLLLGVSEEEVMADFLRSNEGLRSFVRSALEQFAARGGDPELLRPIVTVQPAYLEAALDEVRRAFGTIERYFADGLLIDDDIQQVLRETFLEAG